MNALRTYQQRQTLGITRIDMLLALVDGAIERIEKAAACQGTNQRSATSVLLVRSQLIVTELIAGLDLQYGDIPRRLHDLYMFVLRLLAAGKRSDLDGALRVLRVIRDGFAGIRAEAVELERKGAIPSIDHVRALQATA